MQNFNKTMTVNCSADKLLGFLISEEFENDKNIKANGSLESKVQTTKKDDSVCEYTATTTDYERGITGINKKKTENTSYFYKWDLAGKSATWRMEHPMGKKVSITGTVKVVDKGDSAELQNGMTIEIKVPLVGKKIEKEIVKEIEKGWHKYEDVVRDYAAK